MEHSELFGKLHQAFRTSYFGIKMLQIELDGPGQEFLYENSGCFLKSVR